MDDSYMKNHMLQIKNPVKLENFLFHLPSLAPPENSIAQMHPILPELNFTNFEYEIISLCWILGRCKILLYLQGLISFYQAEIIGFHFNFAVIFNNSDVLDICCKSQVAGVLGMAVIPTAQELGHQVKDVFLCLQRANQESRI